MDHLTCAEVLDMVEPIAAGDLALDATSREHFETCPLCAAALASARRIESMLASREAQAAPPRFTSDVVAAVRRERWRAEQRVDRLFNFAVVAAILLVVGGILALTNLGTLLQAAGTAWQVAANAARADLEREGPSTVGTYLAAAGFMLSAVAMWWWAERRFLL